MKKRTAPGIILAIIGVGLFAYLGIGQTTQKNPMKAGSAIRSNHTIQVNEPSFPFSSLLAGFLFMSGISLVAISAQQESHRQERIQAQKESENT
jgi:hypothetical protein